MEQKFRDDILYAERAALCRAQPRGRSGRCHTGAGKPGPAVLALPAPGGRLRSVSRRSMGIGCSRIVHAQSLLSSRESRRRYATAQSLSEGLAQVAPLWRILRLQRQTRSQSMTAYDVTAEPRRTRPKTAKPFCSLPTYHVWHCATHRRPIQKNSSRCYEDRYR